MLLIFLDEFIDLYYIIIHKNLDLILSQYNGNDGP